MFIRWHGYSCFEFADDENRVVIDPHDGKSIGVFPPKASAKICLCTHNTFDRNAFRVIGGKHKDIVCEPGEQTVDGFTFEGLPSFSDEHFGEDRGPNTTYLFKMDNIQLEFTQEALEAIADEAVAKKTGARGLRAILESVMLDAMYDLPKLDEHQSAKCVIDEDVVKRRRPATVEVTSALREN